MKNILVPVEDHSLIYPALEAALLLGRIFDSYIEGLALAMNPVIIPGDLGGVVILDPDAKQVLEQTSRQHFEKFMLAHGVLPTDSGRTDICFGWRAGKLTDDALLGSYARVFDCAVLVRPSEARNGPRISTTEAILFEGGRPILIAPPKAPRSLGQTIVIAWNRSTETARTVAFAMPLLRQAARVVVVEVEGWGVEGPSGEKLARALGRHGMSVQIRTIPRSGSSGETILSFASSLGCDLLIKGAYTQTRLRQMIFGGATSHILANTTLPVFMAH